MLSVSVRQCRNVILRSSSRAFTLLETMIVVVLLLAIGAVVFPSIIALGSAAKERDGVEGVEALLARAREEAITKGKPVWVVLAPQRDSKGQGPVGNSGPQGALELYYITSEDRLPERNAASVVSDSADVGLPDADADASASPTTADDGSEDGDEDLGKDNSRFGNTPFSSRGTGAARGLSKDGDTENEVDSAASSGEGLDDGTADVTTASAGIEGNITSNVQSWGFAEAGASDDEESSGEADGSEMMGDSKVRPASQESQTGKEFRSKLTSQQVHAFDSGWAKAQGLDKKSSNQSDEPYEAGLTLEEAMANEDGPSGTDDVLPAGELVAEGNAPESEDDREDDRVLVFMPDGGVLLHRGLQLTFGESRYTLEVTPWSGAIRFVRSTLTGSLESPSRSEAPSPQPEDPLEVDEKSLQPAPNAKPSVDEAKGQPGSQPESKLENKQESTRDQKQESEIAPKTRDSSEKEPQRGGQGRSRQGSDRKPEPRNP
jgi:type II secretory pathway pseudopilin PulG